MSTPPPAVDAVVASRIEDWRRRLIDLSHRNRLIAYKPTKATTLEVVAPRLDLLLGDRDRAEPWDFYFPPEPEPDDDQEVSEAARAVDDFIVRALDRRRPSGSGAIEVSERHPKRIARILDNLAKRSNTEFQDKALRILYIAAGFLDWYDDQREKAISSPLVLVPVELRRESTRDPYRLFLVPDEDVVINPSLTEKLRRDVGLELPGDWLWEDNTIDQEIDEIRQAVAERGWQVRDEAVIGLFSFQKYVMYRDLQDNEEQVARHPVVKSLARGHIEHDLIAGHGALPALDELDEVQDPRDSFSILDADATQRQCIEAAKRGRSFVMQGPPGTGKSQTIANLIAESIAQGKRILFVSEKAAALDVVFKRLSAEGLDEYCLMLHGEHAGRREVVQALDRALTSSVQPRGDMRLVELDRLRNLRTLLNDSAEMLHAPQPVLGDRTLREVHEQLATLHDAPSIAGAPEASDRSGTSVLDEYNGLREIFNRLSERWHVSAEDFVWRGYAGAHFTADEHGRVLAILHQLKMDTHELPALAADVAQELTLAPPESLSQVQRLLDLGRHLRTAPALEAHWLEQGGDVLGRTAEAGRLAYVRVDEQSQVFARTWPARAEADFKIQIEQDLRAAVAEVQRQCGAEAVLKAELRELGDVLHVLDVLPARIEQVRERAQTMSRLLGQPPRPLTSGRLDELVELADLTFEAEHRPEPEWLIRAGLDRAQRLHQEIAADLDTYRDQVARIRETYDDAALDLDAAAIEGRFRTQYTSVFSKLSSAYRQDAKAIKSVHKSRKLPQSLAEDLLLIAAAREVGARLDDKLDRIAQAFGSYAAGRETDPAPVAAAIEIARRASALADSDTDLGVLGSKLAVGSLPDPTLAQAADQLRGAVAQLLSDLGPLNAFLASGVELFASDLDGLENRVQGVAPSIRLLAEQARFLDLGAASPAGSVQQLEERASLIASLHAAREEVSRRSEELARVLGTRFAAERTDWDAVLEAAGWLTRWRQFGDIGDPPEVRRRLLHRDRRWPAFGELGGTTERFIERSQRLVALFDSARAASLAETVAKESFASLVQLLEALIVQVDELRDWTEWRGWAEHAQVAGWSGFVDALLANEVTADDVLPAFERAYWHRRLEQFYEAEPELAQDLRGGAFQRWVEEFRALDRRLVKTGADRLIRRREQLRTAHLATPGSEIDLLRREARKKRRHLPVRVLLSRIPNLLSDLKPCLMMSPLTVSHFLSPDHSFDLVVFDEASQVPPQDAINCIYRGEQIIVAGDSKQLPPTPFFQVAELDEMSPDAEDAITEEDMESILDACDALLPSHALQWHYRSKSEPLIAFSNRHIYNDELLTFPSAERGSPRLGVGFVFVSDGVYDRGRTATNRREAEVVARRVMEHLLDGSGRSLGVIAFNTTQANAIAEELDLLKIEHPELESQFRGDRLDAVFVKHLEAVQGDERDVIIFSVGYGRDKNGRFLANFGPLNKDGGQRRLNVAITRARERCEVVASVHAHDFQLAEGASAGARMLRDYVAYAEAAGAPLEGNDGRDEEREWPTPLEARIGDAVERLGFLAEPNVGVGRFKVDLGVRSRDDAARYLLGIECDGEGYARTPTARDRERLRHEVLSGLGWGQIHRIWSLDWVRNRNGELGRLQDALGAASKGKESHAEPPGSRASPSDGESADETPRARVERVVHELNTPEAALALPWTEPYRRITLPHQRSYYEFHESVNRRAQTNLLVDLIAAEAPISIDYAIRRLAEAWGLRRAGHRIVTAGKQAIGQASRRNAVEVRGRFLWRPGQSLVRVRIPDPEDPETRRDIDDIPPEEIDIAVYWIRVGSPGADNDHLIAQVARILGFDRTGERIRTVIGERLNTTASDRRP
jgi:hypothetical protein